MAKHKDIYAMMELGAAYVGHFTHPISKFGEDAEAYLNSDAGFELLKEALKLAETSNLNDYAHIYYGHVYWAYHREIQRLFYSQEDTNAQNHGKGRIEWLEDRQKIAEKTLSLVDIQVEQGAQQPALRDHWEEQVDLSKKQLHHAREYNELIG